MAPAAQKRATRGRQPLVATTTTPEQTPLPADLIEIFNNSQHVTTSDSALNQLKKLYKQLEYNQFEGPFRSCVKRLFQSKQTIYFKTSCEFLCKFLQHVSKLSGEMKVKGDQEVTVENTAPNARARRNTRASLASTCSTATNTTSNATRRGRQAVNKRGAKRKADVSDDELVGDLLESTRQSVAMQTESETDDDLVPESCSKRRRCSTTSTTSSQITYVPVTNHDRIVSSCVDVADHYMQVADEDCRLNAVYFICKFLSYVESLDEEICNALKSTLPKRIRDRKPMIRAQAVLASRTFQDQKLTQEGFLHHFYRDPELVVRKALLQIMDTKIFGYEFLVDSTQDTHEVMRKSAYQRLGKILPSDLDSKQLHRVVHNGLIERERQAYYSFRTHTLEPWLSSLYDGLDLHKLLSSFDVIGYHDDICRLLELVYERDLDKMESNGTTTKLHHVAESFRERWLSSDSSCLPLLNQIDERVTTIWITLLKFCKKNHNIIKPIKLRAIQPQADPNESIEKLLDSQERADEVVELYERLTPDLVNLIDFLKRFVHYADELFKKKEADTNKVEFIYQQLMESIASYEVGDELERKTIQDVLGTILKENLLTGKLSNFISPIIKCLHKLIYSTSPNLMINYISELINNVRSHLEDLATASQSQIPSIAISQIDAPTKTPKSAKKVRIDTQPKRNSYVPDLEYRIADIRVELEELKDKLDECVKEGDYDQAKVIHSKITDLKAELTMLHDRRCSIASDVSHMSMVIETEPGSDCKLSSTMICDNSFSDSQATLQNKDDVKIFKHHTNELIKCLQMYSGCLQNVKISKVPQTMLNHLTHLSYESLDEWFKNETRVRSLMVTCNGLTALADEEFAKEQTTVTLLIAACYDPNSIEVRTVGFKSLVDVICQYGDLEVPLDKLENFLKASLRDYGKYNPSDMKTTELDFITVVVEGSTKLYYLRKMASPEILSHLILWWYHPRTHSKLKQYIGIFLPLFVEDCLKKQLTADDTWLRDLLEDTFVTSIEYLHDYSLGPGHNIMAASDMLSLIGFLCNLIPVSFHPKILVKVDKRIEELSDESPDLTKYLKQAKNSLATISSSTSERSPISRSTVAVE